MNKNNLKKRNNFIERSLLGALVFFRDSIFAERFAAKPGLLQSVSPPIKAVIVLACLIVTISLKDIFLILAMYILCLLLAVSSRINLFYFLIRTWIFIPLFSLFIALPAIFSVFTAGEQLLTFRIFAFSVAITRQGLHTAALFVTRVATCVSYAVLLSLTTKHFELLKVLRIFRVPRIFVLTAQMSYRYIFLLVTVVEQMHLAVKSRVGFIARGKMGREVVAAQIGALWQKSYRMNADVYLAMISRGFNGEPQPEEDLQIRPKDIAFLICALALLAAVLFMHLAGKAAA